MVDGPARCRSFPLARSQPHHKYNNVDANRNGKIDDRSLFFYPKIRSRFPRLALFCHLDGSIRYIFRTKGIYLFRTKSIYIY